MAAADQWISVERGCLDRLDNALAGRAREIHAAGERALDLAARSMRREVVRRIGDATGIRHKDIRRKYVWLRRKAMGPFHRKIIVTGRGPAIADLGARQTRRGVVYRRMGGGLIPHAFIARGRWRRSVFRRRGRPRLPIQAEYGPSLAALIRRYVPGLLAHGRERLRNAIEQRIAWINRGRRG